MSAYVPNSSSRDSKSSFWKAGASVPGSIKPVYGAQHPPMTHKPKVRESPKKEEKVRANKHDAFLNFENSTSDAWDDGDDDLLQMASVQMSLRDVRSSANTVLENHSKQIGSHSQTLTSDADVTTSSGSTHGHSGGGPGVGVRLNSYKTPKTTHVCCVQPSVLDREASKVEKFKSLLAETNIDLDELRQLSWSGIPTCVRPVTWKILAGYLPPNADRREATLERKRREYFGFIDQYYETRHNDMHADTFRQILKDIPRMTTLAHLMQHKVIQQIFERILFIWAIRHPASGYVQGINDLVTPFFVVFLSEYISNDIEADNCDLKELPKATLDIIEADSFWCTSKLLDGIQDNYTFAQPGIQMKVNALQELIKRIDAPLHKHLVSHNVEYLQFSFRWMNNLLMREIPLRCTIRLWDTYLSEVNGFADFHLYVCASFLVQFSSNILRERDFQGILMFLQNLPTRHWNNKEIGEIMAEAYKLKYMFADAPNHLMKKS